MLDTNVIVRILREPNHPVGKRVTRELSRRPRSIVLSSVSVAELLHGVYKSARPEHNRHHLLDVVAQMHIAAFDEEAADHYGEIRATLDRMGTPIGPLDLLIAAHARAMSIPLVTGNLKEFARVPRLVCDAW